MILTLAYKAPGTMRAEKFFSILVTIFLLSIVTTIVTHRYLAVDLNFISEGDTTESTGNYIKATNDVAEAITGGITSAGDETATIDTTTTTTTSSTDATTDTSSNTSTTDPVDTTVSAITTAASTSSSAETSKGEFAYAFLIAGCDPKNPTYRGYIYNAAVTKQLFINFGSTNDVVVMIRMHERSTDDRIAVEDETILKDMGIIIKYLPRALTDNFHTAMMDKFRILQLTDYDRVLYLDADVIPLSNLDFMFELSTGPNAPLEENVALAYNKEPTSGGFFMLKPSEEDYQHILTIIEKREREGYHFNETIGWGHQMIPPDGWESLKGYEGDKWDFYGAFTDQGLIYYWTKYVKKKVSIINKNRVKTYLEIDGKVQLARDEDGNEIFKNVKMGVDNVRTNHHSRKSYRLTTTVPYRDFHHFKEFTKPWIKHKYKADTGGPQELWFDTLNALNDKHGFKIDVNMLLNVGLRRPDLGLFPTFNMVEETKKKRQEEDEKLALAEPAKAVEPTQSGKSVERLQVASTDSSTKQHGKFAYAFLIAGCDPKKPHYRGYIYSVAVAKQVLLDFGSTNDVVVMIRMHGSSAEEKLPKSDEDILKGMGIIVHYLPRALMDNFHTAMMDKFRILQLTDYDRVLYLDADVLPLSNLDFMFELSTGPNAPLEENVALAYNREPTNGGFFMLKPNAEDYQLVLKIIEKREREGYHFNETIGWGHQMISPDGWESLSGPKGSKWDFYGAFTDQGLIYYWTKYVKKKVTIITGDRVKTYLEIDGKVQLARDENGYEIFKNVQKGVDNVRTNHHSRTTYRLPTIVPYRDFHHFKEKYKPWITNASEKTDHGPHEFWYETLNKLNDEHGFKIDMDRFDVFRMPSLGMYPRFTMIEDMKRMREEKDLEEQENLGGTEKE